MQDFWPGKRVLLTGHTGFKGSWLALWLQQLGAEVIGYSLPPPTEPSLFSLARVYDGMRSKLGDLRDLERLFQVFEETRPQIVLHLAAQAIVRKSYRDPLETFSSNVLGTVHVLEAARRTGGVRALVTVTSDKCYENVEKSEGYREGDPLGGRDPYSASKACAEIVAGSYLRSFFTKGEWRVAAATARAGNVIGGGDWGQDRLVPDLVQALLAGETLQVRHPGAVRPWQFVLDPIAGYLRLAERLWQDGERYAEAWNFGPGPQRPVTVGELVDRLAEAWGERVSVEMAAPTSQHEHHLLVLNALKAQEKLDWRPRIDVQETIDWIVQWYRGYRDGEDPRALTLDQIARYQQRIDP